MELMLSTISDTLARVLTIVRVSDLLDIGIVAFLIYKATKMVRETRAEQLVKGIIILLVITQLCSLLNLNTMTYLLKYAMQFGVLALIIVFQPELRRMLEKLGTVSATKVFGNETDTSLLEQTVDEVTTACASLSRQSIGALIVFEQKSLLEDVIKSGTDLGAAKVQNGLLENIFIPNTPLHDGAVIIRRHTVCAACCILPLTKNDQLDASLGTRHRAGLGITEVSDAVSVIVSEETGAISLAFGGVLHRGLKTEQLKEMLLQIMTDKDAAIMPKSGFFRIGRKMKNG